MNTETLFAIMERSLLHDLDSEQVLDLMAENINRSFLDYSDEQDPKPMDTLGNLVDKLCIVNNKMFFNQQWLYETRHESVEKFKEKWLDKMSDLHAMLKRCLDLNSQRSRLMDEIDQRFHDGLTGALKPEDMRRPQHKTY